MSYQSKTNIFYDEDARQYECKKCGAILISDNHSSIDVCCFCGAPMGTASRISGELAPVRLIPFSVSKKKATRIYKKWSKRILFAPKDFAKEHQVQKLVGIYLPFWLFDIQSNGQIRFDATKKVTHHIEKGNVTDLEHYDLHRGIHLQAKKMPVCASRKLPASLTNQLAPFDFGQLTEYSSRYLNHFIAEKHHSTDQDLLKIVNNTTEMSIKNFAATTVQKYDKTELVSSDYETEPEIAEYVFLPVWMVHYDYEDEDYIFLLNGQTGKIAANPPMSKIKIASVTGLIALFSFILLRIITLLLGGPLL